ncbi:hypothetical protein AB9P05_15195 [Roseivirga sp. BDSF3-8]|uniref:hypothetical protein n=1 Tax=Roseivirga sp. BDSF3-8 TaxID=3241598 RepID=UPI0035322D87
MKLNSISFSSLSADYTLSDAESLYITGGTGQVDRDSEEKEDAPGLSNEIPIDYSINSRQTRRG